MRAGPLHASRGRCCVTQRLLQGLNARRAGGTRTCCGGSTRCLRERTGNSRDPSCVFRFRTTASCRKLRAVTDAHTQRRRATHLEWILPHAGFTAHVPEQQRRHSVELSSTHNDVSGADEALMWISCSTSACACCVAMAETSKAGRTRVFRNLAPCSITLLSPRR